MPPNPMSPLGSIICQDVEDIRRDLQDQPSAYQEARIDHICDTFKYFQDALIEAQNDYHVHLRLCENWRDFYHHTKTAIAWSTDRYDAQYALAETLSRQLDTMSQPSLGNFPSRGWWAERFELVLAWSEAFEELDKRGEHLRKMKMRGERGRHLYELYMGEIGFFHDREEDLWREYEELAKDFEDVTLQTRQLRDD
ncbi:hypothetical protein BDR22DRAFT_281518 [Usnea florida]